MRLGKQTLRKLVREELSKVNEGIEPQIKKIAQLTGTRPDAVEDFVSKHALNFTKLLKFLQKGKLKDRMDFMTAVSGKPGNPIQKKMIKMFTESVVNEGKFKVDDLVYNKRTKTVGIVRMGDDKHGEVKTDADGNVSVDELEKYNPLKYKHQTKAKVAPSTEREVSKRGLFNPFKLESVVNERKPSKIVWDTKKISAAKRINVSKWYMKTYPTDELGGEINQKLTLWDFYNALSQNRDIYKVIGVGDSVVRERIFEKLSKVLGVAYDTIYNMWESVNEASDEFVIYVEKDNGRKKLLHNNKSSRAAKMFITKNANKILNQSGIRAVGSMRKSDWERDEAQYAENIKKKGMRTVTKKQWDRTHNDYKGMIKGQPYMMWFDKKTQSTVYGPVQIKESVNEKIEDFETGDLVHIPSINKSAMVLTQYGRKVHVQFPDGKEKTFNSRDLEKIYNESVLNERPNKKEIEKLASELERQWKMNSGAMSVMIDDIPDKQMDKIRANFRKQAEKQLSESVNEGISVFDERHFGKNGIIIMIDDNGKKVSAIFKNKKNANKYNRNKESDLKALLSLAKKTPYPKAIDESINEGKKRFYQQDGIGKAKYTISYHDGKQKHKDGSDFYGIQIFRNKKDLEKFRTALLKKGYREDSGYKKESVNEGKDDFVARHGKANIILKKGYKHHKDTDLEKLYDKLGSLVKGLKVKDVTLVFESVNEGRAFVAAAKKAKEEGKTEFEFNGKTYPVTIKEVLRKRNRKLR